MKVLLWLLISTKNISVGEKNLTIKIFNSLVCELFPLSKLGAFTDFLVSWAVLPGPSLPREVPRRDEKTSLLL